MLRTWSDRMRARVHVARSAPDVRPPATGWRTQARPELHPLLDTEALGLVARGAAAVAGRRGPAGRAARPVGMPSAVVDDLWHELVLHTRAYEQLCRDLFGGFLHHTPEEAMSAEDARANGTWRLRRTYDLAQGLEADEGSAHGPLPLLFRVDGLLRVHRGRAYVADCGRHGGVTDPRSLPPGSTCVAHLPAPPERRGSPDPRCRLAERRRRQSRSVGFGQCRRRRRVGLGR